jgi:photosystem II stability/assembly factor-like uncharacterized protein
VRQTEIWLACGSGIYVTTNGGNTWHRSTPPPDHPERYALYANLASVEGFAEVYCCGWQGIAHWSSRQNQWDLQLPTYFYNISNVVALGGSENRRVWAVGRSGRDEHGNFGDKSHGAIFYLEWLANRWTQVNLEPIEFAPSQALNDILLMDERNVFAVGESGLVIHGHFSPNRGWEWSSLSTGTATNLRSIGYGSGALWAVGDGGMILSTKDFGSTWTKTRIALEQDNAALLRRIRFFGDEGWIVGERIVLKSRKPLTDHASGKR